MRLVYPVLAVLAYLFFVVALAAGFVLVAAVPVVAIGFGVLLATAGQVTLFVRLLGSLVRLTFGALAVAWRLLRDLGAAVFERDEEPVTVPWSYGRDAMPEVFRLVDEVAAAVGTRSVDRILVSHEVQFGVFDLSARGAFSPFRPRRRHLVLGLPFVYALSLDELRAVIAHELGHLALGHAGLTRLTWHFMRRIAARLDRIREGEFWALNPVYWSGRFSLWIFARIYHPWWRLKELDADRRSARAVGANHAISALRTTRDALPALAACYGLVAEVTRAQGVAPVHLGEAAARLSWRLPPAVKRRVARGHEGDPLDLEGRTHPPAAIRIAALHGLAEQPARHRELAAKYLPDLRRLEQHLTRALFRLDATEPASAHVERVIAHLASPAAAAG